MPRRWQRSAKSTPVLQPPPASLGAQCPGRFKFAGYQPPPSINTRAAARFGEVLQERLGNRVDFELIGSIIDAGGESSQLRPMVESGELQACYTSAIRFSEAVPALQFFELPFVVEDRASVFRALDGALGADLKAEAEAATGCRILGFWDNGFRHVTNKVRPIRTPQDCAGLRIRTQMTPLHGEALTALGFEPIAVDIKEFVEQVATDRFQAQENPLANTYAFGVHKHHRYLTLTGHFFGINLLICNAAQYHGWPESMRDAIDVAAADATALQRRLAIEEDEAVLQRLDPAENEVIHLTAEERAAFVEAIRPLQQRHLQNLDARIVRLLRGS